MTTSMQRYMSGICDDALQLLGNRPIANGVARELNRMVPERQLEAVKLMVAANDFSVPFARALLIATPLHQLKETNNNKLVSKTIPPSVRAEFRSEMHALQARVTNIQDRYADDLISLVVASGYVCRLLDNARIVGFLQKHHPEHLQRLLTLKDSMYSDIDAARTQRSKVRRFNF